MIDRLGGLGLTVDREALRRAFPQAALGRKHLADYLVRSGQVQTHRLVFARYLGDDGPAAVAKPLPDVSSGHRPDPRRRRRCGARRTRGMI